MSHRPVRRRPHHRCRQQCTGGTRPTRGVRLAGHSTPPHPLPRPPTSIRHPPLQTLLHRHKHLSPLPASRQRRGRPHSTPTSRRAFGSPIGPILLLYTTARCRLAKARISSLSSFRRQNARSGPAAERRHGQAMQAGDACCAQGSRCSLTRSFTYILDEVRRVPSYREGCLHVAQTGDVLPSARHPQNSPHM